MWTDEYLIIDGSANVSQKPFDGFFASPKKSIDTPPSHRLAALAPAAAHPVDKLTMALRGLLGPPRWWMAPRIDPRNEAFAPAQYFRNEKILKNGGNVLESLVKSRLNLKETERTACPISSRVSPRKP